MRYVFYLIKKHDNTVMLKLLDALEVIHYWEKGQYIEILQYSSDSCGNDGDFVGKYRCIKEFIDENYDLIKGGIQWVGIKCLTI